VFNIALAASILIVTAFPALSTYLLGLANHLLTLTFPHRIVVAIVGVFFKYFLLALCVYFVLRVSPLAVWLGAKTRGRRILLLANVIVLSYWAVRVLASMLAGWAGSFVVGYFAPLVIWPCCLLIVVGFVLLFRSPPRSRVIAQ